MSGVWEGAGQGPGGLRAAGEALRGEAMVLGVCRKDVTAGSRQVGVFRVTGRAGQGACACLEFLRAVRVLAACERRCVLE